MKKYLKFNYLNCVIYINKLGGLNGCSFNLGAKQKRLLTWNNMLIFIIILITLIIALIVVIYVDHQRWDRYQFDRAKFFQTHPYILEFDQHYPINISISASNQIRIMNNLMLKSENATSYSEAFIQRVDSHQMQAHQVSITLADIQIGNLEKTYAQQLTKALEQTDFFVGRPIRVKAEIIVYADQAQKSCKVRLALCSDPFQNLCYLKDKAINKNEVDQEVEEEIQTSR